MRKILPLFLLLLGFGCSGMQRSEKAKIRKKNCQGEALYRNEKDIFYPIQAPRHVVRSPYPWELESNLPKITKEFFRCKGSPQNPPLLIAEKEKMVPLMDCRGGSSHPLPLVHGKEGVYPVLLELLNYLQKKTGKRVVITSGHRCNAHYRYLDLGQTKRVSKHHLGAEVDFYVQGMEDRPLEVVNLLMQYYQETMRYQHLKEYQGFIRKESSFAVHPWVNKEIFIQLYQKEEGRSLDNQHPHPYVSVRVLFDRDENRVVSP